MQADQDYQAKCRQSGDEVSNGEFIWDLSTQLKLAGHWGTK